jgi:hypothetical protein
MSCAIVADVGADRDGSEPPRARAGRAGRPAPRVAVAAAAHRLPSPVSTGCHFACCLARASRRYQAQPDPPAELRLAA